MFPIKRKGADPLQERPLFLFLIQLFENFI